MSETLPVLRSSTSISLPLLASAEEPGEPPICASPTVFDSVEAAIADLTYVYATTARERGQGKLVLVPSQAMAASAARVAKRERHGLLFGPERTGLDNDEVALADAILTFPVNPAYASLNLAQAVLICGYEWYRAAHGDAPPYEAPERSPPAQREMVLSFFDFLEGKLEAAGFFRPAGKRPVMQRNLRNMFHRMELTQQDVRTWWGMVVRLVEGPRVKVQTRKRVKQNKPDRGPPGPQSGAE